MDDGTFKAVDCSFPFSDKSQLTCNLLLNLLKTLPECGLLTTRVIAVTSAGETDPSNTANYNLMAPPKAPVLRSVPSVTSFDRVGLEWDKPQGICPVTCCRLFWRLHEVYRDPQSTSALPVGQQTSEYAVQEECNTNYNSNIERFKDGSQVQLGNTYAFQANCYNQKGSSPYSNEVKIQAIAKPSCPRNLKLYTKSCEPTLVFLDWDPPSQA